MPIVYCDPDLVQDNPFQPRSYYSTTKINELATSIQKVGLLVPPKGRQLEDGTIQLAFGHERKRAFIKLKKHDPANFSQMPVDVQDLDDAAMSIMALEENIRRQDITPLEMAAGIDNHLNNFPDITEKTMAEMMSMTQGNVSNMRRVLRCPDKIKEKIVDGKINFTMARELLVFLGVNLGKSRDLYDRQAGKDIDEEFLMLDAISKVGKPYGPAATVDGIKKAIYEVCLYRFPRCFRSDNMYQSTNNSPLFDTTECTKCEKSIQANETKSQKRRFCTDPTCWEKKQATHKAQVSREAMKKRDAEIARKIQEQETEMKTLQGEEPPAEVVEEATVLQEPGIDSPVVEDFDEEEEEEEDEADYYGFDNKQAEWEQQVADAPKFKTMDEVCHLCIKKNGCNGRWQAETDDSTLENPKHYCLERVTKDNYQEIREKAQSSVPESMKKLAEVNSGTRAQVLDIRDLKLSTYTTDLLAGYAYLSSSELERMHDPDECLQRCTTGFHYGYDSGDNSSRVLYVCTNPKCVSKKKAAYTREKNEWGNRKKKAESSAIKEALAKSEEVSLGHLRLFLFTFLKSKRYYQNGIQLKDLAARFGLKLDDTSMYDQSRNLNKILEATAKFDAPTLNKLLTEICLQELRYDGDICNYKIETTMPLEWLGVSIPNIEKKEKEVKPTVA